MPAVISKIGRENLLQEIFYALRKWPELERRIFSEAHYHGQSPEAISRSLHLDVKEVDKILKRCDRQLLASLRNYRNSSCEKPSPIPAKTACPMACRQELTGIQALAFKGSIVPDNSQIPA
jgi:hypothetical protein